MEWFKHDSNANLDEKLQEVLLDYGLEGYGLYWYCIELIVGKVSIDNITFELKHDARIIARNTGSSTQKVQEMMTRFVDLGLFESHNGNITCFKVAKRLMTSATSNPQMRNLIQNVKHNQQDNLPSRHRHDEVMPDKIRLDKIDKKENLIVPSKAEDNCPHQKIIELYHQKLPMMTTVVEWTPKRASYLKTRWKENPRNQSLDFWARFFDYVAKSDFLTGKKSDFIADLEWLIKSSNFVKILEGKYENKQQG